MRQREEAETSDVVVSIFSILDQDAYVLFDAGPTHSYVSASVMCSTAIQCVQIDYDVVTPLFA